MTFRFTLTDPIGNTKIISEPGGWDTATIGYERHPQFLSLIKYFKSSFQAYGSNGTADGGRDWILAVEQTYGPDALIGVLVELSENDDGNFDEVYTGNIAINMFIETLDQDHLLQIAFNQPDFWAKFISRYGNQVDIRGTQTETEKATLAPGTVTPTPYFNLPLPAQIIEKKFQGVLKNNIAISFAPAGITDGSIAFDDLLLDFDQLILDEISDTSKLNNTPINPTNRNFPTFDYPAVTPLAKFILTEDGEFVIDDFAIRMSTAKNVLPDTLNGLENRTSSTKLMIQVWIQVNDVVRTIITGVDNTSVVPSTYKRNDGKMITVNDDIVTDYTYSGTLGQLKRNDEVRIFAHVFDNTNFVFYNSASPPGSNIHSRALFLWGNQGWDKNQICPYLGGETFIPFGFTDVFADDRFTSLITDSYDPGTDPRAGVGGYPAFEDDAFTLTTIINDCFIIGVMGAHVGSGAFRKAVSMGDFVQCTMSEVQSGSATCVSGSNILNGSGTNFTSIPIGAIIWFSAGGSTGVTRDPTMYIGQVLQINSATQIVFAANATISYANKGWGFSTFWVSPLSLYEGLQAYGGNRLNVTFKSQPSTEGSILHKASTITTNNYGYSDASVVAYEVGISVYVQFDANNTGAVTLKINSLAGLAVVNLDGSALMANEIISTLTASGTNTYALADSLITHLYEGLVLTVLFTNGNTAASTLNPNGLGAIPIVNSDGSAIATGTIPNGGIISMIYDGTNLVITATNGLVTGQVYVLTIIDGPKFEISPITNTDSIAPTANQIGQAFLTHDVMSGVLDRITDQSGLFYSEYLGNPWTVKQYPNVGCGSLLANIKGLHVRGYTLAEKQFFASAQDWWEGIDPIHGLTLFMDKINGQDVIRVEKDEYNFDDSSMSVLFSNVQNITRSYDPDFQFNKVKYGYEKWQSQTGTGGGSPSGIDDPQTIHTRNTLFQRIGKEISFISKWIAASLTIETIRRVGALLSANYTYDNDTIVIKLKANGDGTFTPELNENFSSITNLNDPQSRYNSAITPIRNFYRKIKYLSGCLQSSLGSYFTFASGEGNYDMSSTMTTSCPGDETGIPITESDPVPVSTEFLFIPMPYEINHYMDWSDFVTFSNNLNKSIGISQTTSGHTPFFVKTLQYVISTGLVNVKAWPKAPFKIIVPDTGSSVVSNPPSRFFELPYFENQFE